MIGQQQNEEIHTETMNQCNCSVFDSPILRILFQVIEIPRDFCLGYCFVAVLPRFEFTILGIMSELLDVRPDTLDNVFRIFDVRC